jgi:hypothetical protein
VGLSSETTFCRLRATAGTHHVVLKTAFPTHAAVQWMWRVPSNAKAATWRLTTTCREELTGSVSTSSTKLKVTSRRRRGGSLVIAQTVRIRETGALLSAPTTDPNAGTQPTNPVIPVPTDPGPAAPLLHWVTFPVGQCTYWAYLKRPDIVGNPRATPYTWEAQNWGLYAAEEGYLVDTTPQVGDIVEFTGVDHLAYVESVTPGVAGAEPTVVVSEMNYGPDPSATYFPDGHDVRTLFAIDGLTFIHQR